MVKQKLLSLVQLNMQIHSHYTKGLVQRGMRIHVHFLSINKCIRVIWIHASENTGYLFGTRGIESSQEYLHVVITDPYLLYHRPPPTVLQTLLQLLNLPEAGGNIWVTTASGTDIVLDCSTAVTCDSSSTCTLSVGRPGQEKQI